MREKEGKGRDARKKRWSSSSLIISLLFTVNGREGAGLLSSPRLGPLSLGQHPTNLPSPTVWQRASFQPTVGTLEVNSDTAKTCTYSPIHPGNTVQCKGMMYSSHSGSLCWPDTVCQYISICIFHQKNLLPKTWFCRYLFFKTCLFSIHNNS